MSLSSRERGLKQNGYDVDLTEQLSLSSRERGLKHQLLKAFAFIRPVALFTRAWIETNIISE